MDKIIPLSNMDIEANVEKLKNKFTKPKQLTPVIPTKAQQWLIDTFNEQDVADKACLALTNVTWFNVLLGLTIAALFTEMALVAFPLMLTYIGQLVVLAFTTFSFFAIFAAVTYYIRKIDNTISFFGAIKQAICPEMFFELFFIIIGWVGLGMHSGLAAFRIMRIIRYLWYTEYYVCTKDNNPIFYYGLFYSHLMLQYVDKIRIELFTLQTKGAMTLFALYFFIAYVFAVVFWHCTKDMYLPSPEGGTSGHVSQCNTLSHCYFLMVKMPFADGNAFDYWKSLLFENHMFLFFLLSVYYYLIALIILNGVLGIFAGSAFASVVQETIPADTVSHESQASQASQNMLDRLESLIQRAESTGLVSGTGQTDSPGKTQTSV